MRQRYCRSRLQPDNTSRIGRNNPRAEPAFDHPPESRVTRRKILGAVIKRAVIRASGCHASADAAAFLKAPHFVSGIPQCPRAGETANTCPHNR
jgi:hypothetical protein